jgi:hypothetical protein
LSIEDWSLKESNFFPSSNPQLSILFSSQVPILNPHLYNPPMDPSDPEVVQMLKDVRAKAEHLLSELLRQQAEVEANPPDLPADKLEQGRHAMQKAIDSATRAVKSLDAAQKISVANQN